MEVVSELNLQRLFEMQAQLDADILSHHPVQEGENRLNKKTLALLVELGEVSNEWRGFKFWSNNQSARTKVEHLCVTCEGRGFISECYDPDEPGDFETCINCNGMGKIDESNPLLEEYVDCLSFILSIGNDLDIENIVAIEQLLQFESYKDRKITFVLSKLYLEVSLMLNDTENAAFEYYPHVFQWFLELGWLFGFKWEQIEEAYTQKNMINHKRQADGY